jgi:hypothetical protein
MVDERPGRDQDWEGSARDETETQRLDRNRATLLEELRVTQTRVQLLTCFLLTLTFQQQFAHLSGTERILYSTTVASPIGSTVLLAAAVGMHRLLFRRHRLEAVVATAHRCAVARLMLLGVALCGVAVVTFNAAFGAAAGWVGRLNRRT